MKLDTMSNFIEKIKRKTLKRHDSSASHSSASFGANSADDFSSTQEQDVSEPKLWLPESLSFRTAPLILRDDFSPSAVSSPIDQVIENRTKENESSHRDLGESHTQSDGILRYSRRRSRFSASLSEILDDPSALGYFLTYMESRGFKHLVKFWLETETFRVTATRFMASVGYEKNGDIKAGDINGDIIVKNGMNTDEKNGRTKETRSKNLQQMTEQDAVAIFAKYIGKEATQSIGATDELRNRVINGICDVDGRLDPNCFLPAQQFVLNILENRFINDYLKSEAHCKYVLELLNSGYVYITDILYSDLALFHFTEFMEQESQRNLIEFWLSVDSFQQQLVSNDCADDIEQIQRDAMVIYDRYFSMQATCSLGFDDQLRIEIENKICRDDDLGPSPDCFEKPFRYVLNLMEQKYLPRFMQSSWYTRYLSELINAAQYYDLDLPNSNRERRITGTNTASTVSSGDAGSSSSDRPRAIRNTLLAHESPSTMNRRRQVEALAESGHSDMAIATSTYDSNSLWKRDTRHGFAYVDSVGRYVREYSQASQHKRTKSGGEKITDAVRKLVHHKDNKEKEALAEEVAALIIRDVTNMTCGAYGDSIDDSATGSQDDQ